VNLQRHHVAAFCESLIECGWLVAIIATPLYFNIYSFRVFEPDKAALLRSIALLVAAAWLIEWLCVARRGLGDPKQMLQAVRRYPLAAPVLMIVLTEALATMFSVVPHVSLLGSYVRLQGTLTTLAYLVLFAAATAHIRRPDQMKRMLSAVALSSFPIALYAVVQYLGLDPLIPWDLDVSARPPANLGNPVFLGGYLAMSMLVVLGLVTARLRQLFEEHTGGIVRIGIALAYGVVFALDLVAIVLTQSRGPLLALYIGLVCYTCLVTTVPSAKRLAIAALLLLIVVVPGVLGLIAVRAGTRERAPEQAAARWISALDTGNGSVGVRVAIWKGVIDLMTTRAPLELPDGRQDAWHAIRPILGYGPESLAVTFRIAAQPDLARLEERPVYVDRAHNETLDTLATTGVLGVISQLWLFMAIVWRGLTTLGLLDSRRARWRLSALVLTGGVVMSIVMTVWGGLALLVVAIPLGVVFGLLTYLGLSLLRREPPTAVRHALPPEASIIVIALLAAAIAHFVEISFGVATVTTRTYFWLFAAVLALDGTTIAPAVGTSVSFEVPHEATRWKEAAGAALLLAVALATLAHDYFVFDVRTARWGRLFVEDGTALSGSPSWIALGLFAGTWLVGSLLVLETVGTSSGKTGRFAAWLVPGLSLLLGSLCWVERGLELNRIAGIVPIDLASMLALGQRISRLSDNYGIMLVVLAFVFASALLAIRVSTNAPSQQVVDGRSTVLDIGRFSVITLVALWLVQTLSLRPIEADTLYNVGRQLTPDRRAFAVGLYRQAAAVAFYEDQYAFEFDRVSSR
jgi:O-antigen ligase/polysaccharide polymerase Wzy-like membrane protein